MVGVSPFRGRLTTDQVKKFAAVAGSRATPRVEATSRNTHCKIIDFEMWRKLNSSSLQIITDNSTQHARDFPICR